MKDQVFTIVDFETTGLEPRLDRIIEMGAVRVLDGQIVGEWDVLLNPGIYIPQEATNINGITNELVESAPQFSEKIQEFLDFIGEESVFVAHNADFDLAFLNESLKRMGRDPICNSNLCTFKLAKHLMPYLPKYGVGALAEHFNIALPQAHRALHDARATAEIFIRFYGSMKERGVSKLEEVPTLQGLNKEKKEVSDQQGSLF